ncbi:cysteine--1-D-myo-inosityl 2-amino-2-deoxy-alpha-D-glucopyranoside ligase [Diaminobutyricimonas sp. LJ205]|uniref:cysteine--1-D-myo-inosityl 2-amino-2-deoxy-alpha-D-glucopyranoside ligase n=1 Tax=Diaminobutyricimonas sp. LJ205 TaxID=2683590 RepID=UPI0012F52A52|nr:cysteine--1-D-myo-inosityl 2-amino-2-deoxy-alpha-D-glucopyranoside ligase [Diaminobutyricimonas sp. LJ205]
MQSWNSPARPALPGQGPVPMLFDTVSQSVRPAEPRDGVAGLYVCGITPYDAAHIGHAATYLAFDTLVRLWLDAGYEVRYAQNVTDVDDPLLERAAQTGVDWRDLAAEQTELFRQDMQALGVIPPDHFIAVTDVIDPIAEAVADLVDRGFGYRVDDDVYFDNAAAEAGAPWRLGEESRLDESTMLELFAERGGDPQRAGKRNPLDPLLWRAERDGEPAWASPVGPGRPGWHIECSVIAQQTLDIPITVNGGGSDLVFPHHEFSAAHTAALTGTPLASLYSHAGMVAYQGEKMSKSLGNLVFVSKLRSAGTDPRAIRLALLTEHYRQDWDWTDESLTAAEARLVRWVAWAATEQGDDDSLVAELRTLLAHDLDTPAAVAEVDQHVARQTRPSSVSLDAIEALLGISLR